jgi:hypothetical protein
MSQNTRTPKQQEIVDRLQSSFEIDTERVLFLNPRDPNEPWLPADELESIARQAGGFQSIDVDYENFVEPLAQVVYKAVVIDEQGRRFGRTGVATIGETTPIGEIDVQQLAAGRALSAALRAAGFHPFKSGSVVSLDERRAASKTSLTSQPPQLSERERNLQHIEDEARARINDTRAIHALAYEKGLIVRFGRIMDKSGYYQWLKQRFGLNSSTEADAATRASIINALRQIEVVEDEDEWEFTAA